MLLLVAAAAAFSAVMQYRQGVYDPASAQARRLRSLDPAARLEAVGELRKLGPGARSAIPSLLGALNDGDARVRARAALVLIDVIRWDADDPRAGDIRAALTAALGDPDSGARHAAAVALGGLRPDPRVVVPVLIEATMDASPDLRGRAVGILHEFVGDERVQDAIVAASRDGDPGVRIHAINALAVRPGPAPAPKVREAAVPALKDRNEFVRGAAVGALGRLGLTTSIDAPELVEALSDPSPWVRTRAAMELPYRPGSRAILPALARALADPDHQVRSMAAKRFRWIGLDAEAFLPSLRPLRDDKEESVRRDADEAIRSIETKVKDFRTKRLPDALTDLASPDPDIRRGAVEVLADFGPRSAPAVPALIRSLDDRDATVRIASARTLGRIGPTARDALPALAGRANDPDARVRLAAASALAAIRCEEAGP